MIKKYILIDYENVQDLKNLSSHINSDTYLTVFVAENQKIPTSLLKLQCEFGQRVEWVINEYQGKNSLDFVICFYVGQIFEREKNVQFNIISKDKGFDSLVSYLIAKNIQIKRIGAVDTILKKDSLIVAAKTKASDTNEILLNRFVKHLSKSISSDKHPKKLKTLRNEIKSFFKKESLTEAKIDLMINKLTSRRVISLNEDKLQYHKGFK